MRKNDFVKVYIYRPTYKYSCGLLFSREKLSENLNNFRDWRYEGTTLLEKTFYEKFKDKLDEVVDLSYIE